MGMSKELINIFVFEIYVYRTIAKAHLEVSVRRHNVHLCSWLETCLPGESNAI